jgi:hypothetical protein
MGSRGAAWDRVDYLPPDTAELRAAAEAEEKARHDAMMAAWRAARGAVKYRPPTAHVAIAAVILVLAGMTTTGVGAEKLRWGLMAAGAAAGFGGTIYLAGRVGLESGRWVALTAGLAGAAVLGVELARAWMAGRLGEIW